MLQEGGRQLYEKDPETAQVVSDMLLDLENNGLDAVRKYSRRFDGWDPPDYELADIEIQEAIDNCPVEAISWQE